MMSNEDPTQAEAAAEAAQHVVDGVTSWEYSADEQRIAEELDKGLDEAGVTLSHAEHDRLVEEIDAAKEGTEGPPTVSPGQARPRSEASDSGPQE